MKIGFAEYEVRTKEELTICVSLVASLFNETD